MKRIFALFFASCLYGAVTNAQTECTIPLVVLVAEQPEQLSDNSTQLLESKLRTAVTKNGMEGGVRFANFSLVARVMDGSKEVLKGKRPLVAQTFDIELFVGNNHTGEKFASTTITAGGSGVNEAKAFKAAMAKMDASNKDLQKFLADAKRKITLYYDNEADAIVKQAQSLALRNEFEEALCLLVSVPTCSGGYAKVEQAMLDVWQQYVDYDCSVKIAKARAVWNAAQNAEAAALAGAYLASIDPSSACRGEALELADEIKARIGDEWELYKEITRESVALEKNRIEAIRAIGVAYGNNQKSQTINEHWIVR